MKKGMLRVTCGQHERAVSKGAYPCWVSLDHLQEGVLHEQALHEQVLHEQVLHEQVLHEQVLHEQLLHSSNCRAVRLCRGSRPCTA